MDITAIQTLVASLKTAADVSKALIGLKSTAEVQGKVAELQSALLAAQNSALAATSAQFELGERVRELEAKLEAAEDWSSTKVRYALVAPWHSGAQVYALRSSKAEGDEPHFICTNCFEQQRRVILNPTKPGPRIIMRCPACSATLETGYSGIGSAKYAEEYLKDDNAQ